VQRQLRVLVLAGLAAVVAGLCWAAPGAMAANTIYWTTPYNANKIYFGNLDGSTTSFGEVTTTGATVSAPWGIALDPAAGKIYWANYGIGTGTKISFANLDGSGAGDLATGAATVYGPSGVVVDHGAGKIYWANSTGDKISWAKLDGTAGGDFNTGTATINHPVGVALDAAAGKIYWPNYNGNKISFAKLDNSGGGDLNIIGTTVNSPWGVNVFPGLGEVYWGNFTTNALDYANLDGTGGGVLTTTGAAQSGPMPGVIDPSTGKIYWANWNAPNGIMFANVDGSGGGGTLYPITGAPAMPVILKRPFGTGAPGISTAKSTTPTTLSCSQGAWGGDLLGELLYRAPRTFAYQWTVGGTPIGGATTSSLAVSSPGAYRCSVTATNYAGSTSQTSAPATITPPGAPPPPGRLRITAQGGWTVSDQGVLIRAMSVQGLRNGATVKLSCPSCRVKQTLKAKGKTLSLKKLRNKLLKRGKGFSVTVTKAGFIGDQLTLTVKPYGHTRGDLVRAAGRPFKATHRCLPVGSSKPRKKC
jgi:hypothetical protein